jgi:hypothetical protein
MHSITLLKFCSINQEILLSPQLSNNSAILLSQLSESPGSEIILSQLSDSSDSDILISQLSNNSDILLSQLNDSPDSDILFSQPSATQNPFSSNFLTNIDVNFNNTTHQQRKQRYKCPVNLLICPGINSQNTIPTRNHVETHIKAMTSPSPEILELIYINDLWLCDCPKLYKRRFRICKGCYTTCPAQVQAVKIHVNMTETQSTVAEERDWPKCITDMGRKSTRTYGFVPNK